MHLTQMEIDTLRAMIGINFGRIFCPPPSIFHSHIEASSYTIWFESKPYFANLFAVGDEQAGFRIAIERSDFPRDFQHEHHPNAGAKGVISNCAEIFGELGGSGIIRQIEIYEYHGIDSALVLGSDKGDQFALHSGDAFDEVSYFWASELSWIKKKFALRSVIDSND